MSELRQLSLFSHIKAVWVISNWTNPTVPFTKQKPRRTLEEIGDTSTQFSTFRNQTYFTAGCSGIVEHCKVLLNISKLPRIPLPSFSSLEKVKRKRKNEVTTLVSSPVRSSDAAVREPSGKGQTVCWIYWHKCWSQLLTFWCRRCWQKNYLCAEWIRAEGLL